jgi:acyl-CoA hydrolase
MKPLAMSQCSLIGIAHPKFREDLERQARNIGYL